MAKAESNLSDLEAAKNYLDNNQVETFTWQDVTVTVRDRKTKQEKRILDRVSGCVHAGEIMALMGASGGGKTTLLNVLAHRAAGAMTVAGDMKINSTPATAAQIQELACYVEQEDTLIGSLTVHETLHFAAKLSVGHVASPEQRAVRIEALLSQFGLGGQRDTLIGTPVRKGISGGQKRRVSVASQMVTAPRILFLDEPTSGLDSAASLKVMRYIKKFAVRHRLLVIASIHQPSTGTFELFDMVLLLSGGATCYSGSPTGIKAYFAGQGMELPEYTNPAEFMVEATNIDFEEQDIGEQRIKGIKSHWRNSPEAIQLATSITATQDIKIPPTSTSAALQKANLLHNLMKPVTLLQRGFIKSYRDVFVYGIRIAMYLGLAIMMGTVWLRLPTTQTSIQPFTNAIFFGSAFMSFMAVAYVPAFLEDRSMYVKEHANGLYGSLSLVISNFLLGLPYLFLISIVFSIVSYWLSNFRPSGSAFFTWVMWLFLDLVAAESLVVLISSLLPNFVAALAVTAFTNGLWMSVGGFLVPPTILNVFYRYVFHYIDYQSYVFRGMMVNEFGSRSYDCGSSCQCMYKTALEGECRIDGNGVLESFGYKTGDVGKWVGYMLVITFGLRLFGWMALRWRR